jgi:hypothetical protein
VGRFIAGVLLLAACNAPERASPVRFVDAPTPGGRVVRAALTMTAGGRSEPCAFRIPPMTRAIAVEVVGSDPYLHAIASLVLPDGRELVPLPAGIDVPTLLAETAERLVAPIPYGLHQFPRRGTFAHTFPSGTAEVVPEGWAVLQVASQQPARETIEAVIRMPEMDGSDVLHTRVLRLTDVPEAGDTFQPDAFVPTAAGILMQAGISLVVDSVQTVRGTPFSVIDDAPFGQPPGPTSEMARAVRFGRTLQPMDALSIFIVDVFAGSAALKGFSLGVPGPADAESYYHGVFVKLSTDTPALGRTIAHEVSHYLGLHHVENKDGPDVYPDAVADTDAAVPNLMDFSSATAVTPLQIDALRRSPLLRLD